ncbi:PH domain-containing protein [Corynebacterium bovis]
MSSTETTPMPDDAVAPRAGTDGTASGDGWLVTVTSRSLRIWAWSAVAVIMIIHVVMGLVSGVGDTGATVTVVDQWSFVGIGLLLSGVCLLLLRPRVRVNASGVEVRNLVSAQFYPWDLVHGMSFPKGARWARLELPDFEFVPMMAFQVADKRTIFRDVEAFRRLEDRYMPDE